MSRYTVLVTPDLERGGYTVTVPALPGFVTNGDTAKAAIHRAEEAIARHLQDQDESNLGSASRVELIVASVEVVHANRDLASAPAPMPKANRPRDFKSFLLSAPDMDMLDLRRDQSIPSGVDLA